MAGQQLRPDDADDQQGADRHPDLRRASIHDRVVGNRGAEWQRREVDAELIIDRPGNAHGEENDDRPAPPPDQRHSLQRDKQERDVGQLQLLCFRNQRGDVEEGQRDRESKVLHARWQIGGPGG